MKWVAVRIYTSHEGVDAVCGRLYCLGVGGVQIEDPEDFDEFITSRQPHWDYIDESLDRLRTCETSITAYLTADEAGATQLSLIREGILAMKTADTEGFYGNLRVEIADRDDSEWADNWKQYYKTFPLGERILIRPEWEPMPESDGKIVLSMNPGHLFGAGTHHSTRMCMEQLELTVKGGERALDLGCGSGILSILALLLGAKSVTAVDIDAAAPRVVEENAMLNSISADRYRVLVGDVLDEQTFTEPVGGDFDLVVANIVADVIKALAPAAYTKLRTDGTFITSGIIEERAAEVSEALASAGFIIEKHIEQRGWSCLVCSKKPYVDFNHQGNVNYCTLI